MSELLENFHFIRPLWFYALLPVILLFFRLFYNKQKTANWSKICDPELLDYFLVQNGKAASRYPVILLLLAWIIAVFSLAGPSWQKVNSPIYSNQDALVIILDLSQSMNAQDIKPSRLERAKHKLTDLLKQRREGQTALMVYAGDAHIVSPLTSDNKTILSFIPVLNSSLMPIAGSNLITALDKATLLFKNAGIIKGDILLLSDGINKDKEKQISTNIKQLKKSGYHLSIIGVGSEDGAPIPDQQNSGFIKDQKGNIVLSKLNNQQLEQLANIGGGSYHRLTISDQDIQSILTKRKENFEKNTIDESSQSNENTQQQWLDQGALFVLLILPFALLLFRKGWLLSFLIILLPYPYQPAYSMQWDDLWLRADQQASQSFTSGQHEKAAQQYDDPQWKGSSYYKYGNYQQAIEQFSQSDSIQAKYNTANSLAQLKRFDEALKTYNEVLEKDPKHLDSLKNKKIIEDLLKQQKENKQQQKGDKKSDQNQDNKQDKDSDQQKSDQDQQDSQQQSDQQKQQEDQQNEQQSQQQEEQKKAEQEALNKQKEKQEKEKQQQQEQNKAQSEQEKEPQEKPVDKQEDDTLFSKLSEEEQQSMQQYLQQIKDDPAYLLRRKFYLNSTRSKQQNPNINTQAQQPW
ncbi:MAG: VWA domain-containing protein [Pseudomonadota bacterium]